MDTYREILKRIVDLSAEQLVVLREDLAVLKQTDRVCSARAFVDLEIQRRGLESEAADTIPVELISVEKQEDKRIVFGEVLVPEKKDAHGDLISADEIERAAHLWLARFQDRGVQHAKIVNSKMELFESYIAPAPLTLGGRKVKKGTWLLMLHVLDDTLWEQVKKGEFTGFSMGGFAKKVPAK